MRKPNKNGWYIETREYGSGYAPETILCNTHFNPTFGTTNKCLNDTYVNFMDALPRPTTMNKARYVAHETNGDYYWKKEGEPTVKITKENANWNMSSADLDADEDPFEVSDEALAKFLNKK